MLRRLNQNQAPAAYPDEPAPDPAFQWNRLALPSETSFPVPGYGTVQRKATSAFVNRKRSTRSKVHVTSNIHVARHLRRRQSMDAPEAQRLLHRGLPRLTSSYGSVCSKRSHIRFLSSAKHCDPSGSELP